MSIFQNGASVGMKFKQILEADQLKHCLIPDSHLFQVFSFEIFVAYLKMPIINLIPRNQQDPELIRIRFTVE